MSDNAPKAPWEGLNNQAWAASAQKLLMATYARLPIALVRGEGSYVWDADQNRYLDWTSGVAVTALGHAHHEVARAIAAQAQTLMHCSNLYTIPEQIELAQCLVENTFADKVFFCNSGTEAVEAAIKLARCFAHRVQKNTQPEIICMERSFHGRTLGALSATGQPRYQQDCGPLVAGFQFVPFGDLSALKAAIHPQTVAVMLEPIQGEGGVYLPPENYLHDVRELCDQKGLLLIFDEIQVGIGRAGRFLAAQHWGVEPDIAVLAKGLANGFPIGALLAKNEVAQIWAPGDHASTFGGNPLACRAALATLGVMQREHIFDHVQILSTLFRNRLEAFKKQFSVIQEVRGLGLIWAIDLLAPKPDAVRLHCLKNGLLLNVIKGHVLRLVPPLNLSADEADEGFAILERALREELS